MYLCMYVSEFPFDTLVTHCLQSVELARSFDLNSVMNHEQCFDVCWAKHMGSTNLSSDIVLGVRIKFGL